LTGQWNGKERIFYPTAGGSSSRKIWPAGQTGMAELDAKNGWEFKEGDRGRLHFSLSQRAENQQTADLCADYYQSTNGLISMCYAEE
jgi:hypothetical protein